MKELWRMVRQTRRIATLERLVDGQWRELAEAEDVVAQVMHDYEQLKAVLAGYQMDEFAQDPFVLFPQGVRLVIDVVFVSKYRIGYKYQGVHYIPGAPSYYDFNEALLKCYEAFRERFPQ